jgi:hypothetical protein
VKQQRVGNVANLDGTGPMKARVISFLITASLILPGIAVASELKPETVKAWDGYIQAAKARLEGSVTSQQGPFLWIDADPDRARRVRAGEVVVAPAEKDNPKKVPHGLIHDWIGGAFIPNTSIDEVLRVLGAYDRYQEFYKPRIVKSQVLQDDATQPKYLLVFVQKELGVTAAIDTDNAGHVTHIDDTHAYLYSSTTRVQAIEDYGKPSERKDEEDKGPGYVWRLFTFTRVEQRDGGVYLEIETIALSRGIPFEFRWLIKPLTERVPKETVALTLGATRNAVTQNVKLAPENKSAAARQPPKNPSRQF